MAGHASHKSVTEIAHFANLDAVLMQGQQSVQGHFGDLQLQQPHDDDGDCSNSVSAICASRILHHKIENVGHCPFDEPSVLPTIEFSSDDLRSRHTYSLPRHSRSISQLESLLRTQEPGHAREITVSLCTSSSGAKESSLEVCASRLRAFASRLKQLINRR